MSLQVERFPLERMHLYHLVPCYRDHLTSRIIENTRRPNQRGSLTSPPLALQTVPKTHGNPPSVPHPRHDNLHPPRESTPPPRTRLVADLVKPSPIDRRPIRSIPNEPPIAARPVSPGSEPVDRLPPPPHNPPRTASCNPLLPWPSSQTSPHPHALHHSALKLPSRSSTRPGTGTTDTTHVISPPSGRTRAMSDSCGKDVPSVCAIGRGVRPRYLYTPRFQPARPHGAGCTEPDHQERTSLSGWGGLGGCRPQRTAGSIHYRTSSPEGTGNETARGVFALRCASLTAGVAGAQWIRRTHFTGLLTALMRTVGGSTPATHQAAQPAGFRLPPERGSKCF